MTQADPEAARRRRRNLLWVVPLLVLVVGALLGVTVLLASVAARQL
ncbi:hypothetical protein HQQ80_16230 [Microbacteriaceae bacterium VKM Ac-2855]|nr:hypothetical protein [Microbacteriaceae bacterium VKM Ac-2855]